MVTCQWCESWWKLIEIDLKFELKLIEVDPVAALTPVPLCSNEPILHYYYIVLLYLVYIGRLLSKVLLLKQQNMVDSLQ